MVVASNFILKKLWISQFRTEQMAQHPEYATILPGQVDAKINAALEAFQVSNPEQHRMNQLADLMIVRTPYVIIGLVVLAFLFILQSVNYQKPEAINMSISLKHLDDCVGIGDILAVLWLRHFKCTDYVLDIHYSLCHD